MTKKLKEEARKEKKKMETSKAMAISSLVLRVLTLLFLGASIALLATDKLTDLDGTKITFKDLIAYRYVIATAIVGFLYTLIQVPFAIYYACTTQRMIRNECLPNFDFYGDKIISWLLATGVGAGFAVTFEFKKLVRDFLEGIRFGDARTEIDRFLDRANIATGLLFPALLCMATLSVLSSLNRNSTTDTGFKGFFSGCKSFPHGPGLMGDLLSCCWSSQGPFIMNQI